MTSPNLLDLDALKVSRTVRLAGRDRVLRSMTVGEFIDSADLEAQTEGKAGAEQAKLLIAQILKFLEDTTEAELNGLELSQLMALLAFIRGTDLTDVAKATDGKSEGNA